MAVTGNVSVLAELERIGVTYEFAGGDEVKCACPFHDDNSPSCSINTVKHVFKCQAAGCGATGDFLSFLTRYLKSTRSVVYFDLAKRYGLSEEASPVEPEVVERWHNRIWDADALRQELYNRAVTDDDIRRHRLGENDGRITIPVRNAAGDVMNVRKYLPGAPGAQKMRNMRGRSAIRLFLIDQLKYDKVVICGGEMKAIVAARELNPHGIGALCATGGEDNWHKKFNDFFVGKDVCVCLDIDPEGQAAAQDLCLALMRSCNSIRNVVLPLDRDSYPHGDVNDFVAGGGRLYEVVRDAVEWKPVVKGVTSFEATGEATDLELSAAVHADRTGHRVRVKAVVTALHTSPYSIPGRVQALCDRDQPFCSMCAIFPQPEDAEYDISPEHPSIIRMVGASEFQQREAIMGAVGVPSPCKIVSFTPTKHYNVEDARISPQLEMTDSGMERTMQQAICVGDGIAMNESYMMTGRMHPHPANQQATLVISQYEPTKDALNSYEAKDLERLGIFQPKDWTVDGIDAKLNAVYEDLEANVTYIFQRRDLHLMLDLAYHTPLLINFDGRRHKGWGEVLIVGDSSQGKSEAALGLMRHYTLGERVECKNASVAGLLGGLQQIGGKWYVTWGVIPLHDRRLVIMEEIKGASIEVLSKLTDMRSSGVAEIPKIEKRRTHARTRLIMISNPRSDRPQSSYNYGVESIKELIGGLEDVRRFDACLVLNREDIDGKLLNQLTKHRPRVDHAYTSDLCRSLILWAWTRKSEEVEFDTEATEEALSRATQMVEKFSDDIPIVDRGSMRLKLARMAASLAARTFSCSDDHLRLRVRKCHVEYVASFLDRVYSQRAMGYLDFTKSVKDANTVKDTDAVVEAICATPFAADLVNHMLHANYIEPGDLQDWCGWDRSEAQRLMSLLVRRHCLIRSGRSYRKTPDFIRLLREIPSNPLFVDRPDFIQVEEF